MAIIPWINDLIATLVTILSYVVPGYVFLALYGYIRYMDKKLGNNIFHGIVISFIFSCLYDSILLLWFSGDVLAFLQVNRVAIILILSGICGVSFGLIVSSGVLKGFVRSIGITRTPNSNIWDDIIEPGVWLRVWPDNDNGNSYVGQIKFVEDFGSEPIIVLEYYQLLDQDGDILADHVNDPNHSIMLNTKGFKRIEISKNDDA